MAGRFPGAKNVAELWENLCQAVESISFFSDQELEEAGIDSELMHAPNYIRARGVLGDADYFDAGFFGHSPKVAELMDPQHRLFLECAWAALEDAGYDSERYKRRIGVYAGESMNTYLLNNLYARIRMVASVDSLQAAIGNDKDSLTTEVSYKLNLRGPSVTIQSSSSTSLVAVHHACQSLLNYECDMALAGGVSIHFPEKAGYLYQEGGATSRDGHCRAFDAQAEGFVNGHGAGVVVLKRLEEAIADGDTVLAVIKGSAVNNDGSVKVSYMAPSVDGQAEVIAMAQAIAGVAAETISYVEAHGTATNLGDPIELAALTQAFRASTDQTGFCAIGSVKTNIGHLDAAAGVAGLIKTVLALKHRMIPPSLHYQSPNPQIDFANSPFYVNTQLAEWPAQGAPRRAGVSSFGMGGTNAHVVLEETPMLAPSGPSRPWQLLLLSAKTSSALAAMTTNLVDQLRREPTLDLADVAYTLQVGRRAFSYRRVLVCQDRDDAITTLETFDPERVLSGFQEPGDRPVAFLFSGQGAQYIDMGRDLYQGERVFREQVDRCAELLLPHLGRDIRDVLYPRDDGRTANDEGSDASIGGTPLNQTLYAQPALFVIEYALAQLWMAWGVQPRAMIGHSIGEYVAACLSGVFSLEDALALVANRARLMQQMPGGAMLAVPLPEDELLPLLDGQLGLAAINGPALCVVSGPSLAVDQLAARLAERGIEGRRLHTSHAFHSAMMEPILGAFTDVVRRIKLNPPQIPYISNLTGTWATATEALDPAYWARHLRQPVRFADGLRELLQSQDDVLLEIGPGRSLGTLARQHPARGPEQLVLASLRHPNDRYADESFILSTLGRLWLMGVPIDWTRFAADEQRRRVSLPSYPFERQRYWVEPQKLTSADASRQALRKQPDIADWFFLPSWKPSLPPAEAPAAGEPPTRWLVFADAGEWSIGLVLRLERDGGAVVRVQPGERFARLDEGVYTINPRQRDDYDALLGELRRVEYLLERIVHCWSVARDEQRAAERELFAQAQALGFYSLLFLAQALGAHEGGQPIQITVVSNSMQNVAAERVWYPEKATLLGPCKVIPQEYSHITCRSIDVELPAPDSWQAERLFDQLYAEVSAAPADMIVAYRGDQRLVQSFESLRMAGDERPPRLREGGVYLITGGLGALGLALAQHLARTVRAKLVLLGRSGLPPRDEWAQWSANYGTHDGVAAKIERVRALEALGAEVLIISADVSNLEQMQAAIARTHERFGALNGVIHAAGSVGKAFFQSIQSTSVADCERQFQSKAYGLMVFDKVLQGQQLDFCLLASSLASVLGGLGFVAYTAANQFMDAFAHKHNQERPVRWMTVNWDAWQTAEGTNQKAVEDTSEFAMTVEEGVTVFQRLMSMGPATQVVVSTGPLQGRIEQWIQLAALRGAEAPAPVDAAEFHPRPVLQNSYVAPRNPLEQQIAVIWQEILGIQQVGIHDNFFDLGGNSLTGIQVISRLKKEFNVQLPTVSLYEGPTVSALAKIIDPAPDEQPAYADSRSRGEKRRERRRERYKGVEKG
jgi:acyl transferase domain-containing protein/acyl carrier protein